MNISKDEAVRIPLVNAHRLPVPSHGREFTASGSRSQPQPPAIIIRFGRMIDRERLLYGFERRPRPHQQRVEPTSEAEERTPPSPYSRVTIRTDLPPKMRKERGKLASTAYAIRKNDHLATRIKIAGTKVILQTRKITRNGSTPDKWTDWSG